MHLVGMPAEPSRPPRWLFASLGALVAAVALVGGPTVRPPSGPGAGLGSTTPPDHEMTASGVVMNTLCERSEPAMTAIDQPHANLTGTWTIDPAASSVVHLAQPPAVDHGRSPALCGRRPPRCASALWASRVHGWVFNPSTNTPDLTAVWLDLPTP
jgi:hypothetical protein